MKPYILISCSSAPYNTSKPIDAYEAALAASNIGLEVKYLFRQRGLYQLLKQHDCASIGHKDMAKKLSALPLFEIEDLIVVKQDIDALKLQSESLVVEPILIDQEDVGSLFNNAQQVLVF